MMKVGLFCFTAAFALLSSGGSALATLVYDMEGTPPPSGFEANGAVSVTQSTIGVTQGLNSMRVDTQGSTFVGAITPIVPAALNNPPGVKSILLDLTINEGEQFTGGFADMGVTVYGCKGATCGLSAQFADFESIGALTPGTYLDRQFDLALSIGPNFPGKSFNQIMAAGDLDTVTHFQLYFNQSFNAPMIAYIDNIRAVVPEPASMLLFASAAAIGLVVRRRD
jgi:hypothetical protein